MPEDQSDHSIRKIVMTGQYDARQASFQPLDEHGNKLPNLGAEFWTKEREIFVRTIWEEVSKEMQKRFGTKISAFNKNQFYITHIPKSEDSAAQHDSFSGRILLDIDHNTNYYELARTISHEMGHYYASRKILIIQSDEEYYFPLKVGLSPTTFTEPFRYKRRTAKVSPSDNEGKNARSSKIVNLKSYAETLSVFDEALVELTMYDVLNAVLINNKALLNSIDSIDSRLSYSESIELFNKLMTAISDAVQNSQNNQNSDQNSYQKARVARILDKRKLPTLYHHSVVQIFQEAAWGSKTETPNFNEIAVLINFTYGKEAFKTIVELTTHIDPLNPEESDKWKKLKDLINSYSKP